MSTILTAIRWLSIFTGALSLFYLGNAWFEFGLGEVFTRIYAWYAGILHPVVELAKPVALWLVGMFGLALPVWWKDLAVLIPALVSAIASAELSGRMKIEGKASGGEIGGSFMVEVGLRTVVPIPIFSLIFAALNAGLG